MCTLEEKKRLAYGKAIEGYQFQVGRYNTWMSYYSIFVGALFVALYNIWPNVTDGCCKCSEPASGFDVWFLPLVISVLGFFASGCWYGALLGYRKWNGHWIGVVRKCERDLANSGDNIKVVYDKMPANDKESCCLKRIWRAIKKCLICRESGKRYYSAGYVSTQKITGIFIVFIMLAWIAAFAFAVYKYNNDCWSVFGWVFGISVVIMIVLLCCLHYGHCCLFSSEIIKEKNKA